MGACRGRGRGGGILVTFAIAADKHDIETMSITTGSK